MRMLLSWSPVLIGLVFYFILLIVLATGGVWTILELGRYIRLPRVIGRFAAEVANAYREHRK